MRRSCVNLKGQGSVHSYTDFPRLPVRYIMIPGTMSVNTSGPAAGLRLLLTLSGDNWFKLTLIVGTSRKVMVVRKGGK